MTPVTSSSLVPTPTGNESLVPTSSALVPDTQLTVAINRGQATTVLSEHHNKEQRKRTQQRSATMFAVLLLCVLRATFVHARTRPWAVRTTCIRVITVDVTSSVQAEDNKCIAVARWMVRHKHKEKEGMFDECMLGVRAQCFHDK